MKRALMVILAMVMGMLMGFRPAGAGEKVMVGVLRLTSSAPVFIAKEQGLFRDEGLDVELKFMKSAQPVAMALAAGDLDVGATGLTAGLYNAVAQGLNATIVADKGRVWSGYRLVGLMVSNEAWKAGVRTLADLKGRRVGVTQIGSTFHYMLGNMLEKKGLSLNDVKVTPLGGVKNMLDAVASNRIDTAFMVQPFCTTMAAKKTGHIMLWVSDVMSYQIAGIFLSQKMIEDRERSKAFLRAYIRACRFYYDNCLVKKDGRFVKGKGFDAIMGYISKYTARKPALIGEGLNYNDRNGKLMVEDIQHQIDWYRANRLISEKPLPISRIVDTRLWQEAFEEVER
jgi:NitT/TauT family transport system substrate-binding protein